MASALLAVLLLAASAPEAPVAPEPPRVELPKGGEAALPATSSTPLPSPPPASGGREPKPTSTSTPTSTPTPTPTSTSKRKAEPLWRTPQPRDRKVEPREPLLELSAPARPAASEPATTPPNLTGPALRDELRTASQRRQEELAALVRERARLEKLAADVAAGRAALQQETARLEELVKKAATEKAAATRATAARAPRRRTEAEEKEAQALARTLKGMKAEQAAALVGRLDRPLAVDLLKHLRPGDAAAVLEKMRPEAAAELFALMASHDGSGGSR